MSSLQRFAHIVCLCRTICIQGFLSFCLFWLCCGLLLVPVDSRPCRDGNRSGRKSMAGSIHFPLCFPPGHCHLFQQIPLPKDRCRLGCPVLGQRKLAGFLWPNSLNGAKSVWSLDPVIQTTEYSFARSWMPNRPCHRNLSFGWDW